MGGHGGVFLRFATRYNEAMSGITRYILRQLLGPFLFVTLTLTGIVWLTQSLRFLDLIINKGLSVGGFLYLTLLLLPGFLTIILPIAAFTAILYVFYRLDTDSEIVVMRAAGLSHTTLMRPAFVFAVGVTAMTFALSLYLMPLGFRTFKDLQFVVRNNFAPVLIQEGTFNTVTNGVTVYVRERKSNGELSGILVHDSRDSRRPVTTMAERGALVMTKDGPRVVMVNGNRQEVESDRRLLSLLYFDQYSLDLGGLSESPAYRWREGGERYLHELFNPGDSLDDIKSADKLRAEGHRRLVMPLYALALAFIAVAGVLGGRFNRREQWLRIAGTATLAIGFELVGAALVPMVETEPGLAPAMYVHVVLTIMGAFYFLRREPRLAPRGRPPPAAAMGSG